MRRVSLLAVLLLAAAGVTGVAQDEGTGNQLLRQCEPVLAFSVSCHRSLVTH